MGIPDGFVDCYHNIGCEILFSLGWLPNEFERPIIHALTGPATHVADDDIDWGAAAVAYEYYFAVILHFAQRGGTRFLMCNEPENRDGWHLPAEIAELGWGEKFWDDDAATPKPSQQYLDLVTRQYDVLCRMARLAMDDVKNISGRTDLLLCGPTTVTWDALWRVAEKYCDIFDYHHYHPDPSAFAPMHQAASASAAEKPIMISEFNRLSGAVDIADSPFVFSNALDTARLLAQIVTMHRGNLPLDAVTLYLLAFPSTHRNHKHLVYGDLNVADWSGMDQALWGRGDEWYPSFDELQLRHATPAYHAFRMLARCANATVLNHGILNPSSSGPADSYFDLHIVVTQHASHSLVTIINDQNQDRPGVFLDIRGLPHRVEQMVVRRLDRQHRDQVVHDTEITDAIASLGVLPSHSITQVTLYHEAIPVGPLRLCENSITPGSCAQLALHQTTRLQAHRGDIDVTSRDVLWSSSHPHLVSVSQNGLVQRHRDTAQDITISAQRGEETATVEVPGNIDATTGYQSTKDLGGAAGPDAVGRGL